MTIEIGILRPEQANLLNKIAADVFDDPLDPAATRALLADDRHHLVVARDGDMVVGFISAVHYIHPDKPQPEIWINEVGVAPAFHRQGIARAMMAALLRHGRELGCTEAWVLTTQDNLAAKQLYQAVGGVASPAGEIMYAFNLDAEAD